MKIVDIADDIFREVGRPTDLSIPAISYWIRSNVGALNSYINREFKVDTTTLEILDKNDHEILTDEAVILKKMYMVHFYDLQVRKNIGTIEKESIISVSDGEQSVTKINRNQVLVTLTSLKRAEEHELTKLITAYKTDKSSPKQVAGDDTEAGQHGQSKYNTEFNRID